jgi:hypothetical protein
MDAAGHCSHYGPRPCRPPLIGHLASVASWVLADFGEVISYPLPAETIVDLADLAGQQAAEFRAMTSASPIVRTGQLSLATTSGPSRN